MSFKLEPHQVKVIEYGLKNPYFIMAVDPGGGKTLATLEIAHRLKQKLLVVCPAYLVLNWVDEIKKFYGNTKKIDVIRFPRDNYKLWDTDIAITTYETQRECESLYAWADIVAFDECTRLKSMNAKVSERAHQYIFENSVKRVILMSGTPIKNRVEEFYSLISICNYNPKIKESEFLKQFPESASFADKYSNRQEYDVYTKRGSFRVIKWVGVKELEELKSWLKGIYIRVKEQEFRKTDEIIFKEVLCDNKDLPELVKAFEEFSTKYEDSVTPTAKLNSALITVPHTIAYVRDLLDITEKVVVYSDHVDSCKAIAEHFGVEPIHGGTSDKNKQRIKDSFQNGKEKVLSATIGGFSEGVTLTAAHHMVINDPNWVPGNMKQAYKRIDRLTQTKQCTVHLMINSSQSRFIYKTLTDKQDTINLVV
jgi:SNF2 family DNA or RNA helicase